MAAAAGSADCGVRPRWMECCCKVGVGQALRLESRPGLQAGCEGSRQRACRRRATGWDCREAQRRNLAATAQTGRTALHIRLQRMR